MPANTSGDDYQVALAQRNAAEDLAVSVMWALSGRQFGICPYIVRPCVQTIGDRRAGVGFGGYGAAWDVDHWVTWRCGCGGRCRTSGPSAVHLPGPAQDVVEVIVNGESLDSNLYRLEGDVLHRVGDIWPAQDLSQPMGEQDTWSVQYLRGNPVPAGVDRLTGLLAREFLMACTGGQCRLPRNVSSVQRQGISYTVDTTAMLDAGKTGLPEVDLFLASVNPHRLMAATSVL